MIFSVICNLIIHHTLVCVHLLCFLSSILSVSKDVKRTNSCLQLQSDKVSTSLQLGHYGNHYLDMLGEAWGVHHSILWFGRVINCESQSKRHVEVHSQILHQNTSLHSQLASPQAQAQFWPLTPTYMVCAHALLCENNPNLGILVSMAATSCNQADRHRCRFVERSLYL